jgi:hypothetical protein
MSDTQNLFFFFLKKSGLGKLGPEDRKSYGEEQDSSDGDG